MSLEFHLSCSLLNLIKEIKFRIKKDIEKKQILKKLPGLDEFIAKSGSV